MTRNVLLLCGVRLSRPARTALLLSLSVLLIPTFSFADDLGPGSGDANCDGVLNLEDVNAFVLALHGAEAYSAQYPGCDWLNSDMNADGFVSFGDITPFVDWLNYVLDNEPPVAEFSYQQLSDGVTVLFDATPSHDPEEQPLAYEWDFDDGSDPITDAVVEYSFGDSGTFLVSLTVWDELGASGMYEQLVEVVEPPDPGDLEADFLVYQLDYVDPDTQEKTWREVDVENEVVEFGIELRLDGTASTGNITGYDWDLGNGWGCGPEQMHQFDAAGDWEITLWIYDPDWNCSTVTKTIHVARTMAFEGVGPATDSDATDMVIEGDIAWVSHSWNTLSILDVSNPAQTEWLADVEMPAAQAIGVANGLLYLGSSSGGLHVYEAQVPAPAHIATNEEQGVLDLVAAGNVVYLAAGWSGLRVLDMSTPSAPQLVGTVTMPNDALAKRICVQGGWAYVTASQGSIHLIDVSSIDVWDPQPAELEIGATISCSGQAAGVTVSEDAILACISYDGIEFHDVSNPCNPHQLCVLDVVAEAQRLPSDLTFAGNSLYAGFQPAFPRKLEIGRINVVDPQAPYVMEFETINETGVAGLISKPVLHAGVLYWKNSYHDVLAVDVPED